MNFLFCGLSAPLADKIEMLMARGPHVAMLVETLDEAEEQLSLLTINALLMQGDDEDAVLAFAKRLRGSGDRTPLLMIGRPDVATIIHWLEFVDDVIEEPAVVPLIEARMVACARRGNGLATSIIIGNVEANIATGSLKVNGERLHLTLKETAVLQHLMRMAGSMITKEGLMEAVYAGGTAPDIKIIDVLVCKIRQKLEAAGVPLFVQTVWGRGYVVHKNGTVERQRRTPAKKRKAIRAAQDAA